MARAHSSRLYLLAPNLYATSRKAWEYWQSLTTNERRRYLGVTPATRTENEQTGSPQRGRE